MSNRIDVPDTLIWLCARLRAKLMGNRSTEQQIQKVASRPVFAEPIQLAYRHGWMDAMIHQEEERERRRNKTRPDE